MMEKMQINLVGLCSLLKVDIHFDLDVKLKTFNDHQYC